MSKITKKEARISFNLLQKKYYCREFQIDVVEHLEILREYFNKQILNSDIEWLFENIKNGVPNNYNTVHRSINQLKQYIQEQDNKLNAIKEALLDDTGDGNGDEKRVSAYFRVKQILKEEHYE